MYSPISAQRNAQACADGFLVLEELEKAFAVRRQIVRRTGITPRPDRSRQVFRAECTSTFALAYFASRAGERNPHPRGSKPLVADLFNSGFPAPSPSSASPRFNLRRRRRRLAVSLVSRLRDLAEEQGWRLASLAPPSPRAPFARCCSLPSPRTSGGVRLLS